MEEVTIYLKLNVTAGKPSDLCKGRRSQLKSEAIKCLEGLLSAEIFLEPFFFYIRISGQNLVF